MMTDWMKPKRLTSGLHHEGAIHLSLVIAVLLVFWPVTDHGFINFDDPDYITENRHVRSGLSRDGVGWALTTFHAGNWHPVTWLSHMLDVAVFGLQPGGHHLVGLLLHLANTLLLFGVFSKMTGRPRHSAVVAALFAFHPLHVESVAWAAERKDVLCTFFWMLTLWSYAGYARQPAVRRYVPVFLFFTVGLMAKPMLVTLPFVLLLLDVWPLQRFPPKAAGIAGAGRLAVEKIPLFLVAGISGAVTFMAQQQAGAVGPLSVYTLGQRIGNALVAYAAYLVKTLWPFRLAVFYPHPGLPPAWQIAGAVLLLAVISFFTVRLVKAHPYLAVGWFWFLGTLVPVIGLVQVGAQAMADRYTYVPLIGIFIIAVWGMDALTAGTGRRTVVNGLCAAAVLLVLMAATRFQLAFWKDDISLYRRTLAVTENNYLIMNNLALALADRGRTDEAIDLFRQALRIEPGFENTHNNLGNALMKAERFPEAVAHYRAALRINPRYETAAINLGLALEKRGETHQAIDCFKAILRLRPDAVKALNSLGNLMVAHGKPRDALPYYRSAIGIDPGNGDFHYNLAVALEKLDAPEDAAKSYRAAIAAAPESKQAHVNLGNILLKRQRAREAAEHYHQAIQIDPLYAEARYNMGVALERLGRPKAAVMYYTDALQIDPHLIQARINLGAVLLGMGRAAAAATHFREALRLQPENASAKKNLQAALAVIGRRDR